MLQTFESIKILDLTHVLAGPFATYQLSVLGAQVIRIEAPDGGDMVRPTGGPAELRARGLGTSFLAQNCNKRSVVLDLKSQDGKAAALKLAGAADVIVENRRAGALDRAGLGYEQIKGSNPSLIYCSMTGFGQDGTYAGDGAYDNVIQAASGLMSVTGPAGVRPLMIGAPLLDYATGYAAAFAIAAALHQKSRTGEGQRIDVSMLDVALTLMSNIATREMAGDPFTPRDGNAGPNAAYGCYQTADGLLMLGAYSPSESERLFRALGEDNEADATARLTVEQLSSRQNEQRAILDLRLQEKSAEDWARHLQSAGVPAARVNSVSEAIAMAESTGRGMFASIPPSADLALSGLSVPLSGFSFAEGGPQLRFAASQLGADTQDVLHSLATGQNPWI